jgi:hypothetical protein
MPQYPQKKPWNSPTTLPDTAHAADTGKGGNLSQNGPQFFTYSGKDKVSNEIFKKAAKTLIYILKVWNYFFSSLAENKNKTFTKLKPL